ncbi:hypothetical protein, partial [Pseudomonas syringae group genomosp. 7]|uniref:hypothetical protein n=1 Tax=Pseudomonas syringae group genomosp. 7 TaxID=251699 RepID=UPI00376F9434
MLLLVWGLGLGGALGLVFWGCVRGVGGVVCGVLVGVGVVGLVVGVVWVAWVVVFVVVNGELFVGSRFGHQGIAPLLEQIRA